MEYDLIIVGGGPAGASAGRAAALRGLSTLLIEKSRFPRYKPCAGAVSERALASLDFEIPPSIREREIKGGRLFVRNQCFERTLDRRLGIIVSRSAFDEYLLGKAREAGLDVRMEERVLDFEESDEHVSVRTTAGAYRSRFAVIAEGAQGTLKYRVRRRDAKDEFGICLVTEIEERNDIISARLPDIIEIHFDAVAMGYGWIFPHDGYYSVGIGSFASIAAKPKEVMGEFLQKHGFVSRPRIRGHLIPVGGITRTVASSRVLLCGDAAGFVDPLTGEGIAYAIRSGQIAAGVVADACAGGKKGSALARYPKLCRRDFGSNLFYALLSAKIIYNSPGTFYKVLSADTAAVDKYLETSIDRQQYRRYLRWLAPRLPRYLLTQKRTVAPPAT